MPCYSYEWLIFTRILCCHISTVSVVSSCSWPPRPIWSHKNYHIIKRSKCHLGPQPACSCLTPRHIPNSVQQNVGVIVILQLKAGIAEQGLIRYVSVCACSPTWVKPKISLYKCPTLFPVVCHLRNKSSKLNNKTSCLSFPSKTTSMSIFWSGAPICQDNIASTNWTWCPSLRGSPGLWQCHITSTLTSERGKTLFAWPQGYFKHLRWGKSQFTSKMCCKRKATQKTYQCPSRSWCTVNDSVYFEKVLSSHFYSTFGI